MFRHIKLESIDDLKGYLKNHIFRHVYVSGAYYQYPDGQTMTQKNWLGMDYLIDIDCDHFETSCKSKHDSWQCLNCGKNGKGRPPKSCSCGSSRFSEFNWICDICLEQSKKEVLKFIDIFLPSFDIPRDEITVHFSGNRGYHIIIQSEKIRHFNQMERREFVDYLTGAGLNLKFHGRIERKKYIPPDPKERFGWGEYIYNGLIKLINDCDNGSLNEVNISTRMKNIIINKKQTILDELKSVYHSVRSISTETWSKLVEYVKKDIAMKLDSPVSIDLHRLIRFPNSLHGKTGFIVKEIDIDKLEEFDPFSDAIAFLENAHIKVEMMGCPEFRIKDQIYGPYDKNQKIEFPLPAAIFVLAKEVGKFI
ncbi:MAG: DNA primase small subunit domain-containing protein [Candidatus Helarchaeota archaeon]